MDELALKTVRRHIASFVNDAVLDNRVVEELRLHSGFVPAETEVWDYKRQIPEDARSLAKAVLHIVSFYNSYGGYIIYGVDEVEKDKVFLPVPDAQCSLHVQQLRQSVENYTGEVIDIAFREVTLSLDGTQYKLGLLHIPKRPTVRSPLFFGRNGPDITPGKPLFVAQQAYYRKLDQCVPALTKENFVFIFGNRENPYLWALDAPGSIRPALSLQNTLPDKNLICSDFVGRTAIINTLWRWLGDEFAHVKLLVGDGGKGKTSIAYEFAREVCTNGANGFEKVIWLTAKTRRFVGELNAYVQMPQRHFFHTESFLQALSAELAVLHEEVQGASPVLLKKTVRRALQQFPCLVIVDDVDSAPPEEQKELFTTAMQLANSRNRFLITTRMNFAFGKDLAITVGGLEPNDFRQYAAQLATKFSVEPLLPIHIDKLRATTDGSPLFAESVFRLLKGGMRFESAIKGWKGKLGTEVRNAALKREIEMLRPESRRVLLACALMEQVSFAELKVLTGYIQERLQQCMEELQALFLLSTPTIIKNEPRFAVGGGTALLVLENARSIVPDPSAIERKVHTLRSNSKRAGGNQRVGFAISQAIALLRHGRYADAVASMNAASKSAPKNIDLISTQALCLLAQARANSDRVSLESARKLFRKSYELGQRKARTFEYWYESEVLSEDWAGAVDVATLALRETADAPLDWYRRKVSGLLELVRSKQGTNVEAAVDDLRQAAGDVFAAMSVSQGNARSALQELLCDIHDRAYEIANPTRPNVPDLRLAFDTLVQSAYQGDARSEVALRLYDVVQRVIHLLPAVAQMSTGQRNLLGEMLRKGEEALKRIISGSADRKELVGIQQSWQRLRMQFLDQP
jgi:hypothetical protein